MFFVNLYGWIFFALNLYRLVRDIKRVSYCALFDVIGALCAVYLITI